MTRLRRWVARLLNGLAEACQAASDRLAPDKMSREELQAHVMWATDWLADRREHGCPQCGGRSFVRSPFGSEAPCPTCRGTGLDPHWLAEQARSL